MQGIEVSLNTFYKEQNNFKHKGTKHRKYILPCLHVAR